MLVMGYDGDMVITVGYYRLLNIDGILKYHQNALKVAVRLYII